MLTSTTNEAFIDYTTPTALNIASKLTHKYAIKTGSTDTDYWIVGYDSNALVITWTGYDDNKPVESKTRNQTKKAWASTIEYVLKDKDNSWYEIPKNVIAIPFDAVTGNVTDNKNKSTLFYYVKGSEPNVSPTQYVSKEEN